MQKLFLLSVLFGLSSAYYWRVAQQVPFRLGMGGAVVGDVAYFGGGYVNLTTIQDSILTYNATSGSQGYYSLSKARFDIGVASSQQYVVFGGGMINPSDSDDTVDVLNTITNKVTSAKLTAQRSGPAFSVLDLVVFPGGFSDSIDIWNSTSLAFSKASCTSGRFAYATATVGNYGYIAGGKLQDQYLNTIDVFDGLTSTCSPSHLFLSEGRSRLSAVSNGKWVFFAGGENKKETASATVDILDVNSTAMTTGKLSLGRWYLSGTSVGNTVLFAGGYTTADYDSTNIVDLYDIPTNTWITVNLPLTTYWSTALTVGDSAIVYAMNTINVLVNAPPPPTSASSYSYTSGTTTAVTATASSASTTYDLLTSSSASLTTTSTDTTGTSASSTSASNDTSAVTVSMTATQTATVTRTVASGSLTATTKATATVTATQSGTAVASSQEKVKLTIGMIAIAILMM